MYDNFNFSGSDAFKKVDFRIEKKERKNSSAVISSGGAIIIIIFLVLCLTIFSMLSFSTAFADKKLADRTIKSISDYYEADAAAEVTFARIYDLISSDADNNSAYRDSFGADSAARTLSSIDGLEAVEYWDDGTVYVSYLTKIGDGEVLAYYTGVTLYFNPESELPEYEFQERRVIIVADFSYDDGFLDLWGG